MNPSKISIRNSKLSDLTEIQRLFTETIEAICKNDYTKEQIKVWTSSTDNEERWIDKLSRQYFIVAEIENKIVGFALLENNDYLDLLYVHKDYQRQGIANKLCSAIEKEAIKRMGIVLFSNVSKTAKPFFENAGFKTIMPHKNIIKGVELVNYRMSKQLSQL